MMFKFNSNNRKTAESGRQRERDKRAARGAEGLDCRTIQCKKQREEAGGSECSWLTLSRIYNHVSPCALETEEGKNASAEKLHKASPRAIGDLWPNTTDCHS